MFDKLIITTVLIISLVGCNKQGGEIKSMADLKQRVDKLSNLSKDVEGRRTELYRLIHQYNSQLPEKEQFDIASVDTTIGEPEKELVRAMFREEKDITYNGLLGTIINKNNEIRELENQISKLVNQLPAPYSVQKGDTHYDIVHAKGCPVEGTTLTLINKDGSTTDLIQNATLRYDLLNQD